MPEKKRNPTRGQSSRGFEQKGENLNGNGAKEGPPPLRHMHEAQKGK